MANVDRQTTVARFLDNFNHKSFDDMAQYFTEDVVLHIPYVPKGGVPDKVVGRDELIAFYRAAMGEALFIELYDMDIHVAPESDMVFVFCKSRSEFPGQRPYANDYMFVYRFRDDRIAELWEYFDPRRFEELTAQ